MTHGQSIDAYNPQEKLAHAQSSDTYKILGHNTDRDHRAEENRRGSESQNHFPLQPSTPAAAENEANI